jgi:hypothetical protein
MLETDYAHAESLKPAPEVPVRVFLKSQLMAALRQHARPIIIEDPDLALPFTRMLRARELRLRAVGGLVAEAMSYAISRHYNADVEAHWYIGQYVTSGKRAADYSKAEGSPASCIRPSRVDAFSEIPPIAPAAIP